MQSDVAKAVDVGGEYEVVIGSWLLNYAPDQKTMEQMFANIHKLLKDGGRFVVLMIPPPTRNREQLNEDLEKGLKYGCIGKVTKEVEDGFEVHIVLGMEESQL